MKNLLRGWWVLLIGFTGAQAGQAAFEITLKGTPVGYEVVRWTPAKRGWRVVDTFHIRVNMLGQEKEMLTVLQAVTDEGFEVEGFTFTMQTNDQRVPMKGKVQRDTLSVTVETPTGSLPPRRYALARKKLILPGVLIPMLEERMGRSESVWVFDPSVLNVFEGKISLEKGIWTLHHTGGTTQYQVEKGQVTTFWGDLDLRAQRRPRRDVGLPQKLVNLLERYAIRPKGNVYKIGRARRLVLKLYPVTGDVALDFGPQRLIRREGDTAWVEIQFRDPWEEQGDRDPLSDPTPYLADDPYLQPSDPMVQQMAQEITAGMSDPVTKSEALLRWVFEQLAKIPSVTVPTSTDVLQTMQGDCNEHATLFGGMARALGIPTEVIVGVIYQNGAYYYHAWDAVYLRGRWVWVDPVMGEFPARTQHLMLQRGSLEKQSLIMPLVGKLQIEVQ